MLIKSLENLLYGIDANKANDAILCAIRVPKIIKVDRHLTKF